jgi:hypothetical protein
MAASVTCAAMSIIVVGLKKHERQILKNKAKVVIANKIQKNR